MQFHEMMECTDVEKSEIEKITFKQNDSFWSSSGLCLLT